MARQTSPTEEDGEAQITIEGQAGVAARYPQRSPTSATSKSRDLPPSVIRVIEQATVDCIARDRRTAEGSSIALQSRGSPLLPPDNPADVDGSYSPDAERDRTADVSHIGVEDPPVPRKGAKSLSPIVDMRNWLSKELQAERTEVNKRLELRHRDLLNKMDSRSRQWSRQATSTICSETPPIPEDQQSPPCLQVEDLRQQLVQARHELESYSCADCGSCAIQLRGGLGQQQKVASQEFSAVVSNNVAAKQGPADGTVVPVEFTEAPCMQSMSLDSVADMDTTHVPVRRNSRISSASQDDQAEPGAMPALRNFAGSIAFESTFGFLIIANTLMMMAQVQYVGIQSGYKLQFKGYEHDAAAAWPGAEEVFNIAEFIFGGLFSFELIIKMIAYRFAFVQSFWNWFDTLIVLSWAINQVVSTGVNPMILRLFRIARLIRIIRLIRFLGAILHPLNLMVASLKASLAVGYWAVLVLVICQMSAAMFLSQALEGYITDGTNPIADRTAVYIAFGTFWRSFMTMFMVTLANWAPPCRLLVENVSEYWGVFFLIYKLSVGFSVLNVINGVFLHETFKVAHNDDEIMIAAKQIQNQTYMDKLRVLFDEADESGDGKVSWEEFEKLCGDARCKAYLSAMEIDANNVKELFTILDDGDGTLVFQEFMDGVRRTKGNAKALDIVRVQHDLRDIGRQLIALEAKMDSVKELPALSCTSAVDTSSQETVRSRENRPSGGASRRGREAQPYVSDFSI